MNARVELLLQAHTKGFEQGMKNAERRSKSLKNQFGKLSMSAKSLSGALGLGFGIYGVKRAIEGVTKAAMVQEAAERKLQAAVQGNISGFKAYAAQLQKQTVYGDEVLLQQMAFAKNMGIQEDQLKAVTKAAIGLSAKYDKDLTTSMRLLALAASGETGQLLRMGIVLDKTMTKQEKFNELLGIGTKGFRLARAEAATAQGTFQQFANVLGDVKEELGEGILPVLTNFLKVLLEINAVRKELGGFTSGEFWKKGIASKGMLKSLDNMKGYQSKLDAIKTRGFRDKAAIVEYQQLKYAEFQKYKAAAHKAGIPYEGSMRDLIYGNTEKPYMAVTGADKGMKGLAQGQINAMKGNALNTEVQQVKSAAAEKAIIQNDYYDTIVKREKEVRAIRERNINFVSGMMASSTVAMLRDTENWKDHVKNLVLDVAGYYIQLALAKQFAGALGGMFGGGMSSAGWSPNNVLVAPTHHEGGVVGRDGGPGRAVPSELFYGAQRYHGGGIAGLGPNEVPAILERGERVLPNGGGGVVVNVTNRGTPQNTSASVSYEQGRMIINLVNQDMTSGGALSRSVEHIAAKVR